jgi:GTPase SAR1 family protein
LNRILHEYCAPTYFLCVPRAVLTAGTKRPHSATSGDTSPTDPLPKRVTFSTCEDSDSESDSGCDLSSERELSTAWELTRGYTGLPGGAVDTTEVANFSKRFGGYPKQVYVREEFARAFEIVTARALDRSSSGSTVQRLGIVGSVGVGKSVLLLSACMHLWQKSQQTVIIVRGFNQESSAGRVRRLESLPYPPLPPDLYALIMCKAGRLAWEEVTVSTFNRSEKASKAYEALAASCAGGHILAVDDMNEWCAEDFVPHSTCNYWLYTSRNLDGCEASERSTLPSSAAPSSVEPPSECGGASGLVLVPGWQFCDLHKTAPDVDYMAASWRHYIAGGAIRAFHAPDTDSYRHVTNSVRSFNYNAKDTGVKVVDALTEPEFHLMRRVYIEDIHDPASYTDPSKWLTVFDVGLAFPMIAHILPTEVVLASLELAMRWQQPVWAEGAMCGYMHQLAAQRALQITLRMIEADGARPSSDSMVLAVTADSEFRAGGSGGAVCLATIPGDVTFRSQCCKTRYWHALEWCDAPIHAVLCCPAQKIVVLLQCTPHPPALERSVKSLRKVVDTVRRAVPEDCKVVLAAVVLEGYPVPDGQACFTAREGKQAHLVDQCVGTFRAM